MNKEEAKHLSDVLKAYSEGKEIQYRDSYLTDPNKWIDGGLRYATIIDFTHNKYRIKPEPKLRPYKSAEEFLKAQKEHGPYLQRRRNFAFRIPLMIGDKHIKFNDGEIYSYESLIESGKWQDGTLCGILE